LTCFPGPGGAYTGDSGVPSNFYDIQWQILEMRRNTTEGDQPESLRPECQYVWSLRYIDAPVLRDENTDQDGLCDDQRLYYLGDANFNVTTLVDTGGDAVERYIYSPYGKVTIYDATWSSMRSASSYDNVVLYTGREYDCETGLYHYRNRYYSAELGRFVARDPILYEAGDVSLYQYVLGNPVNKTDPSGEAPILDPRDLVDEANRRRGNGPWDDSAQHCWAACYTDEQSVSRRSPGASCLTTP
jgi:RHS repeat-associated protein